MSITRKRRQRRASGQALTEYGSAIAFVAAITAMVFSMPRSSMANAISTAYQTVSSQFALLLAAANQQH